MTTSTTSPDTGGPAVNPITIDPDTPAPAATRGDGDGNQRITIGLDPEALNRARNTSGNNTNCGGDDGLPTIRAVPTLVTTTGSTTTASALAWGPALGPLGLAAIATTTAVGTAAVMVATRTKGARGATRKTTRTTRTTRSGGLGGGLGSRRSGGAAGFGGGGKGKNGLGGGKNGAGAGKGGGKARSGLGSTGSPNGNKAKRGAALLAGSNSGKGKNGLGGGKNGAGAGKGGGKNGGKGLGSGQTGKAGTHAALKKAADKAAKTLGKAGNSMPGRAARAVGRGLHKATTKPLGKGLKKAGKALSKSALGKAGKALGRGLHKATTKPVGKLGKKAWKSAAGKTVRAAVSRLGRAARERLITRPGKAIRKGLKKLWDRIRPGRGLYAHAFRSTAIGTWALFCSTASLVLGFGFIKKDGEIWAWRVLKNVWTRLYSRSRNRWQRIRHTHKMTGHVDDMVGADGRVRATGGDKTDESFAQTYARRLAEEYAELGPKPDMSYVGAEYKGLGSGIRSASQGVGALAANACSMYTIPPHITQPILGLMGMLDSAAEAADDMYRTFRSAHSHDIMRLENPRVDLAAESGWNIVEGVHTDGGGITDRPSHFADSCKRLADACEAWIPNNPVQVRHEFSGMSGAVQQLANTVQRLRDQARDIHPVHDVIPDQLGEIAQRLHGCASEAARIAFMIKSWYDQLTYEIES